MTQKWPGDPIFRWNQKSKSCSNSLESGILLTNAAESTWTEEHFCFCCSMIHQIAGTKVPSAPHRITKARPLPCLTLMSELSHCAVFLMMFVPLWIATVCIISWSESERCETSHCSTLRGKRKCTQAAWLQRAACYVIEMDGRRWNVPHKGDRLRHNGFAGDTQSCAGRKLWKQAFWNMTNLLCFCALNKTTQTNRA